MSVLTPASVFRNFVVDGVAASGDHEPDKAEIRALLERYETIATSGAIAVATKAELDTITDKTDAFPGFVYADATAGNNGVYSWDDSGNAWVKLRGLPDTFAKVTLGGTANAQTGTLTAGVDPATVQIYFAVVTTENTGAMTLSIGGETARDVVNAAGNALSAGEWTGRPLFYLNDGGDYQLLNDPGSAAAAAQSASDAADTLASFNAKYLGALADDTAANTAAGGSPAEGQLYFDTSNGQLKVYHSGSWVPAESSVPDGSVNNAKVADNAGIVWTKLKFGVIAMVRVRAVDTAGGDPATAYEAGDTVDGVVLAAGDIVLRASSTASANDGPYEVAASGAASRLDLFPSYNDLPGVQFSVEEGTTYADTIWICRSNRGAAKVLGTDALSIVVQSREYEERLFFAHSSQPTQPTDISGAWGSPGQALSSSYTWFYPAFSKRRLKSARLVVVWNPNTVNNSNATALRLVHADSGPSNITAIAQFAVAATTSPISDGLYVTSTLQALLDAGVSKQLGIQMAGNANDAPKLYKFCLELEWM